MLEQLKISRFKTIRDLTLQFGRVNLFIGGNGTGKSNILEAVGLTAACLERGLGDSDIGAKGLRLTPATLMKSSFKGEELPKTLQLDASFGGNVRYKAVLQSSDSHPLLRFFSESSECRGRAVFGRSGAGARAAGLKHPDRLDRNRGIWDQIKASYEIPAEVTEAFAEFSKFVIYSPQTDFLRGRQSGRVDNPPIGLHGEGLPEAVSTFLQVLGKYRRNKPKDDAEHVALNIMESSANLVWLPGWASSFGSHRSKPTLTSRDVADRGSDSVYFIDKFMNTSRERNRLSVYDSSEGTLFLLFSAIIMSHPDSPKIFALDNVDSALNPRLTRALVEQIVNTVKQASSGDSILGARQVMLTSHNPTALDAFDIFDDDQRVFVVRRNAKGHTQAVRLEPPRGKTKEEWQIMVNGRNLSQVWLDGDIPGAMGI